MKVRFVEIAANADGQVRIEVFYQGRHWRLRVPYGFKGTRDELGALLRKAIQDLQDFIAPVQAILPVSGEEWELPDDAPATKAKPAKKQKA